MLASGFYNLSWTASLLPKVEPTSYYGPGLLWCWLYLQNKSEAVFTSHPKKQSVRTKTLVDISEKTEAYKHVRQSVHPSFRWWRLA